MPTDDLFAKITSSIARQPITVYKWEKDQEKIDEIQKNKKLLSQFLSLMKKQASLGQLNLHMVFNVLEMVHKIGK